MLGPKPAGQLKAFPVDRRLNKPGTEGTELARPINMTQETLI